MTRWDPGAEAHLLERARFLDAEGHVAYLRSMIGDAWHANLDRHDPKALGDTTRGLALLTAENISARLARDAAPGGRLWGTGVRLIAPNGATRLLVDGATYSVIKAPSRTVHSPDWQSDFDWTGRPTRFAAADENDRSWLPGVRPVDRDPLFEFTQGPQAPKHAFVVWAGFMAPMPTTAGWLGFPSNGSSPWSAVVELWRDRADDRVERLLEPAASETFDSLPTVEPVLRARPPQPDQNEAAR